MVGKCLIARLCLLFVLQYIVQCGSNRLIVMCYYSEELCGCGLDVHFFGCGLDNCVFFKVEVCLSAEIVVILHCCYSNNYRKAHCFANLRTYKYNKQTKELIW